MNMRYAIFVNGSLVYAPSTITTKRGDTILNPKRLSYLQAGYKQLVDDPPSPPLGKSAALTRYDETSDTITAVYKFVPAAHTLARPPGSPLANVPFELHSSVHAYVVSNAAFTTQARKAARQLGVTLAYHAEIAALLIP